jgi:hypothetical protein
LVDGGVVALRGFGRIVMQNAAGISAPISPSALDYPLVKHTVGFVT